MYCSGCGENKKNVDVMLAIAPQFFLCDQCVTVAVETVAAERRNRAEQKELNRFVAEAFDVWPKDQLFVIAETEGQPS